jgi:hypothetical protein
MADARVPRHRRLLRHYATPHCPGCGFDLHGLPPTGNCPECGTAYDPESCAAMRRGPEALPSIAFVLGPMFIGGLLALASFVAVTNASWPGPQEEAALIAISFAGFLCASAGVTMTCWRGIRLVLAVVAAQPPKREESPRRRVLGWLGTGALAIVGLLAFGCTVLGLIVAASCLV